MEVTVETAGVREELTVDRVIVAAGVQGNVAGIGLETLGVRIERGCVAVDGFGRTSAPGVMRLEMSRAARRSPTKRSTKVRIASRRLPDLLTRGFLKDRIPARTYSHPQIASVGLTEAKAKEAGHQVKVGRFPFAGNGKAIALGDDQGRRRLFSTRSPASCSERIWPARRSPSSCPASSWR